MGPAGSLWFQGLRRARGGLGRAGLISLGVLVVVLGLLGPTLVHRGIHPTDSLFTAAAEPASPFKAAALSMPAFHVVDASDPHARSADLFLGAQVRRAPSDRGAAALKEFVNGYQFWVDAQMRAEPSQAAAFPVDVTILQVERSGPRASAAATTAAGGPNATTGLEGGPALSALGAQTQSSSRLRPVDVRVGLPTTSLILTFAYVLPGNLIAQSASATMFRDRIRNRTTLLLSTPHTAGRLLAWRLLAPGATVLVLWVTVSIAIRTNLLGALAALPLLTVALLLGTTIGLCSRSEREVTFLLTATTTVLSTFLFLPAFFTAIPPVAAMSPITTIAAGIRGEPVAMSAFFAGTLPLVFLAVGLAATSRALHHEEAMASIAGPLRQIVGAVSRFVRTPPALLIGGILAVPFALVVELLWLAFIVPLGLGSGFVPVLIGSAMIEEVAKLAVARAWARSGHRTPGVGGGFAGIGFFIGQRIGLVLALAGLTTIRMGAGALSLLAIGPAWLQIGAMAMHVAAGMLGAIVFERWGFRAGMMSATLLHLVWTAVAVVASP